MKQVDQLSDEQLLAAHRLGQADAFDELVHRYYKELFQFMVRFTGQVALAEDVVQETFLQVHLSADTFDPQRRFRPWLFTIGANKARDALRKQARRPMLDLDAAIIKETSDSDSFAKIIASATPVPEQQLMEAETRQKVRQLLNQMPQQLREIIVLAYYHRFQYKQIAEMLDIPLGTVKSRLHGAVAHLAVLWKRHAGQDED